MSHNSHYITVYILLQYNTVKTINEQLESIQENKWNEEKEKMSKIAKYIWRKRTFLTQSMDKCEIMWNGRQRIRIILPYIWIL